MWFFSSTKYDTLQPTRLIINRHEHTNTIAETPYTSWKWLLHYFRNILKNFTFFITSHYLQIPGGTGSAEMLPHPKRGLCGGSIVAFPPPPHIHNLSLEVETGGVK